MPTAPVLDERGVAELVGPTAVDREGWANDIVAAIRMAKKEPTAERACAVIAVIEQESGYQADPAVPNLPRIVMKALEDKLSPLGPLAKPTLYAILDDHMGASIETLHTERDLDRLFRETISAKLPPAAAWLTRIDALNPVTTAGSMQVQVAFARELSGMDDADTRELLYTRAGGVRFGTARLLGYGASYDDIIYRFADYNAGVYAARNAAFQEQLAQLAGTRLALDGDLLDYHDGVESQTLKSALAFAALHELSERRVRRDLEKEKTLDFESTELWYAVRDAWQRRTGKAAPYARVPEVTLTSPKMSRTRTTAWFAESVKRRYAACRQRQGARPRRRFESAAASMIHDVPPPPAFQPIRDTGSWAPFAIVVSRTRLQSPRRRPRRARPRLSRARMHPRTAFRARVAPSPHPDRTARRTYRPALGVVGTRNAGEQRRAERERRSRGGRAPRRAAGNGARDPRSGRG